MNYKRETYIDTGKANCFTRIYCSAPEDSEREKIVLVHGLGMSGVYMHSLATELANTYNVYVPDLPGFGKSSKPRHVLNIQELADALHGWAQAFPVERAWYVGNSTGCQIITDFAIHYPHRVKGAVLQGLVIDPYMREAASQMKQFIKLARYEPVSLIMIMLKEYAKCGIRRFRKTFEYALNYKTEAYLPLVAVPVLVVWGEKDTLISQKWAQETAELLPQGNLKIVREEAHTINFTAPVLLAHLTVEFILSKST